jgi:hypothetical protein
MVDDAKAPVLGEYLNIFASLLISQPSRYLTYKHSRQIAIGPHEPPPPPPPPSQVSAKSQSLSRIRSKSEKSDSKVTTYNSLLLYATIGHCVVV